jgi:hypothetical protein
MRLAIVAILAAAGSALAQDPRPAGLDSLLTKTGLVGKVAAWCAGKFESGRAGAYAIAVASGTGGGRYLVLGMGEREILLAPFKGGADLACYTPAAARALDKSIAQSGSAIHGGITPKWNGTVVCGFVEDTSAVCWQYSPAARAFVKVGGWIT